MQRFNSRSEWASARRTTIGASDSAALLGVSPWKGALQLYHEKKGTAEPSAGETFARKLGLALEDPIAQLYADDTGRAVVRPAPGTFDVEVHPRRRYMVATLDGTQVCAPDDKNERFRGGRGVLEIKTAAISKAALWTNEAPIDYQVQVQHQLAVTGFETGTVVALVGGVYLVHSDIVRDAEFIALLEASIDEFVRRLELSDPPPADGTDACREFLKKLYPIEQPVAVTLPPEAVAWEQQWLAAKAAIKRLEALELEAANRIKVAMGEATIGVLSNGSSFTWKTVNRSGYQVQPTSFRDFRRKGSKQSAEQTLKKGQAPRIDDILAQFETEQALERDFDGEQVR